MQAPSIRLHHQPHHYRWWQVCGVVSEAEAVQAALGRAIAPPPPQAAAAPPRLLPRHEHFISSPPAPFSRRVRAAFHAER